MLQRGGSTVARTVRDRIRVEVDREPPELTLLGSPIRAAAVPRLELEASEPIDGVRLGRCYFPAQGNRVTVTAKLRAGMRKLPLEGFDLAGNRTRTAIAVEVDNRVLVLDGHSAVRVAVPRKPARFTLECWARFESREQAAALLSDADGGGGGLFVKPESGIMPFAVLDPYDRYVWLRGMRPLKRGRWVHLAMTYDGETVRLWLDGKPAGERAHPRYRRSKAPLWIGADPGRTGPGSHLEGAVDEVRLSDVVHYTEAFEPAAVHAPDRHTVVLYHFDTDTGESFEDASGRGQGAQPVGTPEVVPEQR